MTHLTFSWPWPTFTHVTCNINKTCINLPRPWLKNSEVRRKQQDEGAEAEKSSPWKPFLKESRVVLKEWQDNTEALPSGYRLLGAGSSHQTSEFPQRYFPKALRINQRLFLRVSQIFLSKHFHSLCLPSSAFLPVETFVSLYWYFGRREHVHRVATCFLIWFLLISNIFISFCRGCRDGREKLMGDPCGVETLAFEYFLDHWSSTQDPIYHFRQPCSWFCCLICYQRPVLLYANQLF